MKRDFDELMCDLLEVDKLDENKKLTDHEEWSSLTRRLIIATFEQEFSIYLKAEYLESKTVGQLRQIYDRYMRIDL